MDVEAAKKVVEEEFAQPAVVWCKVCHLPSRSDGGQCKCAGRATMRALARARREMPRWDARYDRRNGGTLFLKVRGQDDDDIYYEIKVSTKLERERLSTIDAKWYAHWDEDPFEYDYVGAGKTPLQAIRKVRKHIARVAAYYAKLAEGPTKEAK